MRKIGQDLSNVSATSFTINGKPVEICAPADTPLIYVIRNDLNLKGTRFGCGDGYCGACTIIIDGRAAQSCTTPLSFVEHKEVETIEALLGNPPDPIVSAIQSRNAWQCGYCLSGIIMRARALCSEPAQLTRQDIARALNENYCRCGAHPRILDALTELFGRSTDAS